MRTYKKPYFHIGAILPLVLLIFTISDVGFTIFGSYLLWAIITLLLSDLIRHKWLFLFFNILSWLIFCHFAVLEFAYAYLFHARITPSTIYVILESNANEASDFLDMYFKTELMALYLGSFLIVIGNAWIGFKQFDFKKLKGEWILIKGVSGLCLLTALLYAGYFFPKTYVMGWLNYTHELEEVNSIKVSREGYFKEVSTDTDSDQLVVLVIGESTTRDHMSLYDYYRKTNPLLEARKK